LKSTSRSKIRKQKIRKEKIRKEKWGTSLRIADDLWRLRLRHPDGNPTGRIIVNTYVHRGGGELAVIDPGWPGTIDGLEAALADLGLAGDLSGVDRWLYTHAHIDHMGAAALLQARSRAPHTAWRGLRPVLSDWHRFQDDVSDWKPWIRSAFIDPHRSRLLDSRRNHELRGAFGPRALERAELIEFGDSVRVGELNLEFIDARGHGPHHGAFFERERGWLFSGDVALAVPTPICRAMGDDLASYRESLARLEALPTALFLPGHGLHRRDRIDQVFERAREFVEQYARETAQILAAARTPLDLHELALRATPEHEPLTPTSRWWVHMALIDSHLHDLIAAGRAELLPGPSGPLYRSCG
jgi:glyoxylase-like metal-dependent hydrolase (beta-lactamase superfamily II)